MRRQLQGEWPMKVPDQFMNTCAMCITSEDDNPYSCRNAEYRSLEQAVYVSRQPSEEVLVEWTRIIAFTRVHSTVMHMR